MGNEYARCDLCQQDNTKFLFYDNNFGLVKCSNCGLVYINPRPSSEDLKEIYNNNANNPYYNNYLVNETGFRWGAKKLLREIKRTVSSGKLLDIGCGGGFLLDEARQLGFEVCGLEMQEEFTNYARHKLNLKVWNKSLEAMDFNDNYFDIVCMLDIISHLDSPLRTLKEVRRILKKGGLLLIKTGNKGEFENKRQGELWQDSWGSPEHLYHFSKRTLRQLLFRTGFKIIRLSSIAKLPHPYGLFTKNRSQQTEGKMAAVKKIIYPYYARLRNITELTLGRILGKFKINSIIIIEAIKD